MRTEVYVDGPEDTVAIMYPADLAPEFTHKQAGSCGTYDPLNCMNTVGVTFKKKPAGLLMPYGYPAEYFTITKEEAEKMALVFNGCSDTWAKFAEEKRRPKFVPVMPKDQWVSIHERSRTYHFADGKSITIDKPAWLFVSSSGTHYVTGVSGLVHIVSKAWLQIVITE